jgi:predicted MPP superfamily phosphohydrolase
MLLAQLIVTLLALFGHFALWIAVFNRLHGTGLPRWAVDVLEKPILGILLGVLALAVAWISVNEQVLVDPLETLFENVAVAMYFWSCFGVAIPVLGAWGWRTWHSVPRQWIDYDRRVLYIHRVLGRRRCGKLRTRMLARLPGNQIWQLEVNEKTVTPLRLPPGLDGLTIAHLSDLHFTGQISREFFAFVVAQTNALQPDLIAITGDLLDKAQCLPWIPDVLGRLRSPHGTFCILGNHDQRIRDIARLRETINDAGLHYLGGCRMEIRVRNQRLLLAGNELPWFGPAGDWDRDAEAAAAARPLRIGLSHSPDQLPWARRHGVDLLLAGHTHGGQIRLPLVGPIISPSLHGVQYASGVFFLHPTLLHVSRGISGEQTLRINCRPELTKLVLRCTALQPSPVRRSAVEHAPLPLGTLQVSTELSAVSQGP